MFDNLISKSSILPALAGGAAVWFAKPFVEPFVTAFLAALG